MDFNYKSYLKDDVADTKVPLESVNFLSELLAHVGHVGPLAGLGEEQQEAELGGPQQPSEAHTIALCCYCYCLCYCSAIVIAW